jgi:hypothetical protein
MASRIVGLPFLFKRDEGGVNWQSNQLMRACADGLRCRSLRGDFMPINEQDYRRIVNRLNGPGFLQKLPDELVRLWSRDYIAEYGSTEMTLVTVPSGGSSFTYLFDLNRERNIVSFGFPLYIKHTRDKALMATRPTGADSGSYDKGHLLAHSLGGGTDINLVPQLSKLNRGAFRELERLLTKLSKEETRSFYFVRTLYPQSATIASKTNWLPGSIEQCVIEPSKIIHYRMYAN